MAKKKAAKSTRRTKRQPGKSTRPASQARSSWQGNVTFGLVSFAVEAFNALDRDKSDIRFHQLHAQCHHRIHYAKVCPVHGEVSNDEVVSGYEQSKGHYVEIDSDELAALRTTSDRALTIDAFVAPSSIDPIYYDGRMYYLLPDGKAAQGPYGVIVTAMAREESWAVGQIVFSGKDQVVLLRPVEGVLHMAMLNYDAEIRRPEQMTATLPKSNPPARQLSLAQTLIRDWSVEDFDFSRYTDSYRERVEALIEAKSKGKKLAAAPKPEEEPATINLMEALKKSLEQPHRPARRKSTARKKRSA